MSRYLLAFVLIAALAATPSLSQAQEPGQTEEQPAELVEGNVWTTEDGTKYYVCPVMMETGPVEKAPAYSDVEGTRYYHCCPICPAKFQEDPEKYIGGLVMPGNVFAVDEDGTKHFRDPVSDKEGVVGEKTLSIDHEGHRYYFAKKKTMKKFKKDPSACLQKG